jgi:hypothetical protein
MRVKLSKREIVSRAKQGLALNLRQLATATGYCYSIVAQKDREDQAEGIANFGVRLRTSSTPSRW